MTIYPVILCGGSGSRLWPLSREHYPKPLLPLTSGQTLLQETAVRLDDLQGLGDAIYVCTINKGSCILILQVCGLNIKGNPFFCGNYKHQPTFN